MPLIVNWLVWLVPLTVRLTVIFELVTEKLFTANSLPPPPESLVAVAVPALGLQAQPAGAVRISVLLLCAAKSPVPPSTMTIWPRIAKPGVTPLSALAAGLFAPPEAPGTGPSASAAPGH